MNNKSFIAQCICTIFFLVIFSSCDSNSNQVKEMTEIIMLAHADANEIKIDKNIDMVLDDDILKAANIGYLFASGETFKKMESLIQCGAKLDSVTYIGHNWFKVSYDLSNWDMSESGDEDGLAFLYWKIKKEDDKFKLDDVAYAYSQCTSYIEDLPVADRIKFWFNTIKYDDVQPYFQGNICKVRNDDKYGFINIEGIEILPCKYDTVAFVMGDLIEIDEKEFVYDDCWDSLLCVKLDDKYGLINFDGKEIAPCKYDDLTLFTEYLYLFKTELDDKYGMINFEGKEIIPCKYSDLTEFGDVIKSKSNNKYGLITYEGKEIIPCEYDDFIIIEENVIESIIKSKSNDKYGLIKIKSGQIDSEAFTVIGGEEILPCLFDNIEIGEYGMLKVQKNNLWGYYKEDGTQVMQVTEFYEDVKYYYDMDSPLFAAKSNGKWGYINKDGDVLISFVLDYAGEPDKDGTAYVVYYGQSGELDINTRRFSLTYDNSANNSGNSIIRKACPVCSGTGQMPVRVGGIVIGYQQCPACGGLGYFTVPSYWP